MSGPGVSARIDNLVWNYPLRLLNAAFGLGLLIILGVAIVAPVASPFFPLVLLGAAGLYVMFRHPLVHLSLVLAAFVFVADFQEGIDAMEVAYALLYSSYLATWFFRYVFLCGRPLIKSTLDIVVLLLLAAMTAYVFVGLAFGGKPMAVIAEFQSWTMLAFYFPVRDAVSRYQKGYRTILIVLVWLGLFVVLRNGWWLAKTLQLATEVWHVTLKGRVVVNELLIVVPTFGTLALALQEDRRVVRWILFGISYVLLFGLIVTQGRGFWIAFAVGLLVLFFVVEAGERRQILAWSVFGLVTSVAAFFVFFGDYAYLLAVGLLNRVLSIGTATSSDTSLIGRFIEFRAVLADIVRNPILGYGHGVPITYWDISILGTRVRPWIHNGYESVWFKYGIVGFSLVISMTVLSIRYGLEAAKRLRHDRVAKAAALMAAVGMISTLVATIPANVWNNSDTILMIAIMAGISSGARERMLGS